MAAILKTTFPKGFALNFTEGCFQGFDRKYVTIISGNGLAPNKRRVFTWNSGNENLQRHMASLYHNGLMWVAALLSGLRPWGYDKMDNYCMQMMLDTDYFCPRWALMMSYGVMHLGRH